MAHTFNFIEKSKIHISCHVGHIYMNKREDFNSLRSVFLFNLTFYTCADILLRFVCTFIIIRIVHENEMKIPLITRKMWESGLIMSVCLHRTVNFKGKTFSWKMTNLQFGWESKTKIFTSWDSAFVSFTSFFHQLNLKKKIVRRIKDTHTHFFYWYNIKNLIVCVCVVCDACTREETLNTFVSIRVHLIYYMKIFIF